MSVGITSWRPVTIALGDSLSAAIPMAGMRTIAIRQDVNVEGTSFSFQASYDGGTTYEDVQTDAAELTLVKSATVAQVIIIPQAKQIYGATHLKVRTGTSGSASVQTGTAATVWVCLEDVEAANGG